MNRGGNDMQRGSPMPSEPRWLVAVASGWISRQFFWLVNTFPHMRKFAYGALFDMVAAVTPKLSSVTMMNYGFADLDDRVSPITLEPGEESERYSLQLYHRVAGTVDLKGRDVLDVSCGRGGGAPYILRNLGANHVTGLDFCQRAITFCRRVQTDPRLTFIQGNAEALPLPDEGFDAVVNIESSFCYPDMDRFLSEVRRVLKRDGYFAFADLRAKAEVSELLACFDRSGLEILEKTDITQNVRRALELDGARRANGIRGFIPRPLRTIFGTYAGVPGSRIPTLLERGEMTYLCLLLRKPLEECAPL